MRKLKVLIALVVPLVLAVTPYAVPVGDAVPAVATGPQPEVSSVQKSVGVAVAPAPDGPAAPGVFTAPPKSDAGGITKSKRWEKIDFASRKLTNNVWGATDNEKLGGAVYLDPDGSFGCMWSRQEPRVKSGVTVQPIYPNVRVGGSPWEASNSAHFPVRLGDVKSLRFSVEYRYPVVPTGTYNLAYDMFLTERSQPSKSPKPRAEVMIWLHATREHLPVTYRGDFTDGYNTYGLYSWVMLDGRRYYSFVMKGAPRHEASYTVDAGRLLDALELDPDWYIPGVELGNEIWNGTGTLRVTSFGVNLNGTDL